MSPGRVCVFVDEGLLFPSVFSDALLCIMFSLPVLSSGDTGQLPSPCLYAFVEEAVPSDGWCPSLFPMGFRGCWWTLPLWLHLWALT